MSTTPTERRLAITPGDWTADNYSVLDSEGHEVVSTDNRELTILIADAGTVYNACHLTPSEMLAELAKLRSERDELVGALRRMTDRASEIGQPAVDAMDGEDFHLLADAISMSREVLAKHKPE